MDGEERERKNLEDQIARAKAAQGDTEEQDVGLQKKDGEKITLNLFDSGIKSEDEIKKEEGSSQPEAEAGPSQSQSQSDPSHSPETDIDIKPETTKPLISFGATPSAISLGASANPLKRPAPVNIFKQAKSAKTESESGGQRKGYISEAERLMKEDQARKMRGPGGYGGFGPKRDAVAGGGRRFVLQ